MRFILALLFFICTNSSFGVATEGYALEIKDKISELGKISASAFVAKVEGYRTTIEKYIENKKRVCDGEFSTIVLKGDKEVNDLSKHKLTRKEKFICFEEVKSLQILYINNMYVSRKRYLDFLHEDRIKMLGEIKNAMIVDVKNSFTSKSDKKKRKKRRR